MKKNGWLIYNQKDAVMNEAYINWFVKEAQLQDLDLTLIIREDITAGIVDNKRTISTTSKDIPLPVFVVMRVIDPILSLHIEALGIRVFNSARISQLCNNKELTHHHIHNLNVPMVDTLFTNQNQIQNVQQLDYPFVVKETKGRGGKQVFLIENERDLYRISSLLSAQNIIIQSCNVIHGRDLRVFVVGNAIVGSVLRENKHDFRANFKLGGSASWYSLNTEELEIVKTIINHFSFDMVGIDFLFNKDGTLLFNEIEDVVGSRTLSHVSEVNILQKYVSHIKTQL